MTVKKMRVIEAVIIMDVDALLLALLFVTD